MMRRLALLLSVIALLPLLAAGRARADLNLFGDYWDNIPRAVEKGDAGTVQRLLADGINPQQLDEKDRTGLIVAALTGNLQIFAILMKAGARLDVPDPLGNTALHYAADRGRTEMVKLMLALHAPVDAENRNGQTPLMMAASHGNAEIVQALLAAGANPKKDDYTGRDAVGWAREGHKASVVQMLERAAAGKR
jgi:hypothetical protein